jgi:Fe-S oxidoreductase
VLPAIAPPSSRKLRRGYRNPAEQTEEVRVRVALLTTCLVDGLFPDVGRATVGLLERLGHRVEVPPDQTCCGQMHVNTGYVREALPLVRRHVAVFEGYEAVVVPSGSCAGSVRHQHAWRRRRGRPRPPHPGGRGLLVRAAGARQVKRRRR